jgi:hypothetical protein
MSLILNGDTGISAVDGTASAPALVGNDTDTGVWFPAANTAAISTGGSERMRIDSSGNLLVNRTSNLGDGKLGLAYNQSDNRGITLQNTNATNTGNYVGFYNSSGTLQGTIAQTNSSTTAYNTSSDYRLKENIAPMTGALATVSALKPVTYKWKSDGSDGQGFIAHELQTIVPDCVTGDKDAVDAEGNPQYQGIDTSFLVATLTAAIQELNAKVEAQAAKIAELEAK